MRDLQPLKPPTILRKKSIFFFFVMLPLLLLLCITTYFFQSLLIDLDTRMIMFVHQFASPVLDQVAIILNYLGGVPTVIVFMLLLVGYSMQIKSKNISFILTSVIGAVSISWLLKVLVNRPRPMLWPRLVPDYGASFPSGHSVYAAALACIVILLFWRTKWRFAVSGLALVWMVFMGLARVYLGVHYPSDVLAGWALGWGWVFLVYYSLNQIKY